MTTEVTDDDVKVESKSAPIGQEPFAVFPTAELFQKRVDREAKKALKELGIENPETLKSVLAEHEAFKKAAQEAERAQMTEVERLRADLAAREKAAQDAMSAAEEAKFDAHIYRLCVKKGIKNHEYAKWMVANELTNLPEDGQLDEEAYFDQALQDGTTRAALGVEPVPVAVPAVPVVRPPVTTTPKVSPSPTPGGPIPEKTAYQLSDDEWRQRKAQLGLG